MPSIDLCWNSWIIFFDHSMTPLGCRMSFWINWSSVSFLSSDISCRLIISLLCRLCFVFSFRSTIMSSILQQLAPHLWNKIVQQSHTAYSNSANKHLLGVLRSTISSLSSPLIGLLLNCCLLCHTLPPWEWSTALWDDSFSIFRFTWTQQSSKRQYPAQVNSGLVLWEPIVVTLCRLKAKLQYGCKLRIFFQITFVQCRFLNWSLVWNQEKTRLLRQFVGEVFLVRLFIFHRWTGWGTAGLLPTQVEIKVRKK